MRSSETILGEQVSNTVRTYPRTLQEAFPKDYADTWWEPPRRVLMPRWLRITAYVVCVWAMLYAITTNALGAR